VTITHLLYLHGFRSSPLSTKAQQTAAWVRRHRPDLTWWCPQLPPSPRAALDLIGDGLATWPREQMAVIGSSLGGFYATIVAERCACPAVLLNPAVNPARDLAKHIGDTKAWHSGEHFFFEPRFVEELAAATPPEITRGERCFAIIAKGDELLDWREMCERYAGCRIKLLEAGDHALSDFESQHLGDVLGFLNLTSE